jgi:hygromycin-B 7''-O-kinase
MDLRDPLEQLKRLPFYKAHFMDPLIWRPYVEHVCQQHGYNARLVQPGLPGTYPTFIVTLDSEGTCSDIKRVVVKFFGPLFDGASAFAIEEAVALTLEHHPLRFHSPDILTQGQLTNEWSYLVFQYIPGVSVGQVREHLSAGALMELATQMGEFLYELHGSADGIQSIYPMPGSGVMWQGFPDFIENQLRRCVANHQKWNDLPAHLLKQLPAYLLSSEELIDPAVPPHLIHADLTADHVLGKQVGTGWQILAIIDWGDARLGNILYELVALHLDLFQRDVNLLHACLDAYQLPAFYQHEFPHKAFSMVLLHQFPMPARFYAPHRHVKSLNELAERLFGK